MFSIGVIKNKLPSDCYKMISTACVALFNIYILFELFLSYILLLLTILLTFAIIYSLGLSKMVRFVARISINKAKA